MSVLCVSVLLQNAHAFARLPTAFVRMRVSAIVFFLHIHTSFISAFISKLFFQRERHTSTKNQFQYITNQANKTNEFFVNFLFLSFLCVWCCTLTLKKIRTFDFHCFSHFRFPLAIDLNLDFHSLPFLLSFLGWQWMDAFLISDYYYVTVCCWCDAVSLLRLLSQSDSAAIIFRCINVNFRSNHIY